MSDDLAFCPVPYVDPVRRLASLVEEAYIAGTWLLANPPHETIKQARESIQRAIVGTERIGHSLRYGMGKRAGEFETELRRVLGELKSASDSGSMPPCTPYYADYFSQLREDVERTSRMYAELLTTASEPYDPKQWSSRLVAFRGALVAVHHGMAQFFKGAEQASDSWEQTGYHVETSLIPLLEERLAEVMPSIAFALEDVGCSDFAVETLCWQLRERAGIIYRWGVQRRDEAGSCDKPSDQFGDCCQRVHSLIDFLTPLPPDDRAETPQAVTGPRQRWEPPEGFVGRKTICSDPRFQKDGKNPPPTTIDVWVKAAERSNKSVEIVKAPDSGENHYPEDWILDRIANHWHPRQ